MMICGMTIFFLLDFWFTSGFSRGKKTSRHLVGGILHTAAHVVGGEEAVHVSRRDVVKPKWTGSSAMVHESKTALARRSSWVTETKPQASCGVTDGGQQVCRCNLGPDAQVPRILTLVRSPPTGLYRML